MFDIKTAIKAQQWEIIKGHLRALVAIEGSVSSGLTERPYKFEIISIKKFIKEFEDNGFHE